MVDESDVDTIDMFDRATLVDMWAAYGNECHVALALLGLPPGRLGQINLNPDRLRPNALTFAIFIALDR